MAIGKSPYISSMSGNLGSTNTRTRKNDKIEIGTSRAPCKKCPPGRSPDQQAQNAAYADVLGMWQSEPENIRSDYNRLGSMQKITGFNIYMKERLNNMFVKDLAYKKTPTHSGIWVVEPTNLQYITDNNPETFSGWMQSNQIADHISYIQIDLKKNSWVGGLGYRFEMYRSGALATCYTTIFTSHDGTDWWEIDDMQTSSETIQKFGAIYNPSVWFGNADRPRPRYIRLSISTTNVLTFANVRVSMMMFYGT